MSTSDPSVFDSTHRAPVDRGAVMMFARGEKVRETEVPDFIVHSQAPLPVFRHGRILALLKGNNLTGMRRGRLVVTGLSRDIPKRWVVRCDCGAFEVRKAKAIRNPNNDCDACVHCKRLIQQLNPQG